MCQAILFGTFDPYIIGMCCSIIKQLKCGKFYKTNNEQI